MSKQKIEDWLVENTGYFYDDNRITMNETIDIIHKYTQDQSGWNEDRTVLLQAARFYAEQASYNGSWKTGDPFHAMEDRGEVARNAIFKVSLPPAEEARL